MGEPKVGKTSIIKAFVDNKNQQTTYQQTNVVSDFSKLVKVQDQNGVDQRIQLNILDAAGDASLHDLAHLFLRDVQCGVLIFSIDSKRSFDKL